MSAPALTFCDVSCLYTPTGGGIRTYQRAKLDWFARQQRHRYVLVHPGATESELEVSPTARVITVRGMRVRGGYRLPFNLPALASIVQRLVPDVLETGDPWLGGPIGLLARQRGHTRLVSSFFHGNPIHAYVMPWAQRGRLRSLREQAGDRWTAGSSESSGCMT